MRSVGTKIKAERKEFKMKKKIVLLATIMCLGVLGMEAAAASSKITGTLEVSAHIVPILKDKAYAITTMTRPSKNVLNCASKTTVKIYNKNGTYVSGSYNEEGSTWDLPINAGATAQIRAAKKAVGTHKAKSYDTNYKWVSTPNTVWNK